ncbi:hypothetical protein CL673_05050 [Candidatus Bathyarchaeota archaeon]|nr:hypothetical protein [Candidatus Bathyarchaeota archaeon]
MRALRATLKLITKIFDDFFPLFIYGIRSVWKLMQLFFFLRKNGSQGKSEQSAQFSNQQISQIHNFLESFRFYSHNRRRGKRVRAEMVFGFYLDSFKSFVCHRREYLRFSDFLVSSFIFWYYNRLS